MLVLTLRPGQTITINPPGQTSIVIGLPPDAPKTRIWFEAPRDTKILRSNAIQLVEGEKHGRAAA